MLLRFLPPVGSLAVSLIAAVAASTLASAGNVLRIAGDGSEAYVSVTAAYVAAQDGDTLLIIKPPVRTDFHLVGKGVTLINVSAPGWHPEEVSIRNLGAGSTFVMRGMEQATGFLRILDCDGAVLVTDSTLVDTGVDGSGSVSFSRCNFIAEPAYDSGFYFSGEPGLTVENATVQLEACQLTGADGAGAVCGSGFCQTCCAGGSSGLAGLHVLGTSLVRAQTCTLRGGDAGLPDWSCNCPMFREGFGYTVEPPALLVLLNTPTLSSEGDYGLATVLSDTPRGATLPQSVVAGAPFPILIEGEPGDTVFLLSGEGFAFRSSSIRSGFLQIDRVASRQRILSLPPSGMATVPLTAPDAPHGEVIGVPLQMAFLKPNGDFRFAPASILDVRGAGVPTW